MKVVITGTHFTPAQAVIDEMLLLKDIEIVYIGRKNTREGDNTQSVESQILPKLGVKFISLTTGRLQRNLTIFTIPSIFKIPWGFIQALTVLLKEKPEVVLSFGGYVAVPVVIAAYLLSIPIIIHEQTLVSGLANTISSFFANRIAVSFATDYSYDKKKVIVTGNPLRKELLTTIPKKTHKRLPLIYITGGNQGSHIINQNIAQILSELTDQAVIIHQTGDSKFKDFEMLSLEQKKLKHPERYIVSKWFESFELLKIMAHADIAVSRAGANTLTELAYFNLPTIVIPIPYLYKNEQNVNAKFFEKFGLVKILPQKDLSPNTLLVLIKKMLSEKDKLKKTAQKSSQLIIPDAAQRLMLETLLLAKK